MLSIDKLLIIIITQYFYDIKHMSTLECLTYIIYYLLLFLEFIP